MTKPIHKSFGKIRNIIKGEKDKKSKINKNLAKKVKNNKKSAIKLNKKSKNILNKTSEKSSMLGGKSIVEEKVESSSVVKPLGLAELDKASTAGTTVPITVSDKDKDRVNYINDLGLKLDQITLKINDIKEIISVERSQAFKSDLDYHAWKILYFTDPQGKSKLLHDYMVNQSVSRTELLTKLGASESRLRHLMDTRTNFSKMYKVLTS